MIIISKSDLEKKLQLLDHDIIVVSVARDEELEITKLIVATFDDDFGDLRSIFTCDEIVEVSYDHKSE